MMKEDDPSLLGDARKLLADIDEAYVEFVVATDQISSSLQDAVECLKRETSGSAPRDILPKTPLPLEDAACLPIFGGRLCVDPAFNRQGNVSAKVLRDAINEGQLGHVGLNKKNRKTSLELIEQWIASCQEPPSPRISSGSSRNTTKRQASSNRVATGPSSTSRSSLALDAALNNVMRLRGSGSNTK
jgi:hypothetical protein